MSYDTTTPHSVSTVLGVYSAIPAVKDQPQWEAGYHGVALVFDGRDDYVDCGSDMSLEITSEITVAAWVKTDIFEDWDGLVTKGTSQASYAMQLWGDGSLRFSANWGTPTGAVGGGSWNSDSKMTVGEWTHAAITCDGSTVRFHLNGEKDTVSCQARDTIAPKYVFPLIDRQRARPYDLRRWSSGEPRDRSFDVSILDLRHRASV
ncbi:MAG: LamG domain-containing protein [Sedimentisphaerales bacterium]|nr:LamG domain-containing protein [Sedimentisphaerales bacterium]